MRLSFLFILSLVSVVEIASPPSSAHGAVEIEVSNCFVALMKDIELAAEAPGAIRSLTAHEGMQVTAHQKLGHVDDGEARSSLRLAQLEHDAAAEEAKSDIRIRAARKDAEVAKKELDAAHEANRIRRGAIGEAEVRRLELLYQRALLSIEQAQFEQRLAGFNAQASQAKVQRAQDQLERRQFHSPLDGVVVEVRRHVGEWVAPGDTILRIVQINRLSVEGFLNNSKVGADPLIGRDAIVDVDLGKRRVTARGKVTYVSPLVQAGGDYRIRVEVDNIQKEGQWLLRPGQRASLRILAPGAR